jgi:hypothetical protein
LFFHELDLSLYYNLFIETFFFCTTLAKRKVEK